ncbi:MAG: GTP 3',8-cyclase MoaA [Aestuariibacter sp.]
MLSDTFGRKFQYLRLSITELCNFRCNYCLPDGSPCDASDQNLTIDEIGTLVTAFARLGTQKIRITGGEPCLRKDLVDIIALCKQTEGIRSVALTTNGYNLAKQVAAYQSAGLDAVNISADSLDPRLFKAITGKDLLNKVLAGVDAALASGLRKVKLNTVLLRQYNASELVEFLRYLKRNAVSWRFIELMQTGDNQAFFQQNHVSGETIKQQLQESGWQYQFPDKLAGPAQEFWHPDYLGRVGLIMPYAKDFCKTCNRLRVSSKGKLHLCLFGEEGIDLRAQLRAGDIDATCEMITTHLHDKVAGHQLHQGYSGSTQRLASLGG